MALIVKVQQSLSSSDRVKRVLIYSEDKAVFYETDEREETNPIAKLLGDRPKAYFEADLVDSPYQKGEKSISLGKEVGDQDW